MGKSLSNQRHVYKISSSRFRANDWNLTLEYEEAIKNNEIVKIKDSNTLRIIREIKGDKSDEEINKLKRIIREKQIQGKNYIKEKKLKDRLSLEVDYLMVVFDNSQDWLYANSKIEEEELILNGKSYKRLLGTNGGIKNNTVVFTRKTIHAELDRRLNNGRNEEVKYVPAKFEAYKALACSSSDAVELPRIIVIKDPSVEFNADVLQLTGKPDEIIIDSNGKEKKKASNKFELKEVKDYHIKKDFCDGCGMVSPEQARRWAIQLGYYHYENGEKVADFTPSGLNSRWFSTKGIMATFPFVEYGDEIGEYIVEDAWGDMRDIREADVILTTNMVKLWEAFDSYEHLRDNAIENGFDFAIAKMLPDKLETSRNMNYQFLQSFDMTDEDIDELIKPTIDDIKGALAITGNDENDFAKMLLFLKGNKITEKDFIRDEFAYTKALMIDSRMKDDPFLKQRVKKMISKKINDAKKGVIQVNGHYSIVIGDLYGMCQGIFKKPITGLLKANEFYSKTWIEKGVYEVLSFRAPMTIHNNITKMPLVTNEKIEKYFRYQTSTIIINAWDTTMERMNGCDMDGDAFIITDNKVLLRTFKQLPTVVCEQKSSKKKVITEANLVQANKQGFNNNVGGVTNQATSMFEILAKFPIGSREYNEMIYRITCMQGYQQEIIDSCKGIIPKKVPKEWFNYKYVKIEEDDSDEIRLEKEFNQKLLASKKPYFFIYNYPQLKKEYEQFRKSINTNSLRWCNMTLEQLMASDYDSLDNIGKSLYKFAKDRCPVEDNGSIMNRLCHRIEELTDGISTTIKEVEFDNSFLVSRKRFPIEKTNRVNDIYKEYTSTIGTMTANSSYQEGGVDDVAEANRIDLFMNYFKDKALEVCDGDSQLLTDILVNKLYKNSSKYFIWQVCGNEIVDRLLEENNYKITYPVQDENGTIIWSGNKYSLKTITINKEEE